MGSSTTLFSMKDMPKLDSPFIRKIINDVYVVTPEINPGYEWVFQDETVLATEKLDGTNVSIVIENGVITQIYNRTERIPFFNKGKQHIIMGVMESFSRGYCNLSDGQWFGELIGEKVNGNTHKIIGHLWIPFNTYAREHLAYNSWNKYPKTFENISKWFKEDLFSLWTRRKEKGKMEFPEGIVFVHPDGRMAKLRRDMFDWFKGERHKRMVKNEN